jgi:hypothetical protein
MKLCRCRLIRAAFCFISLITILVIVGSASSRAADFTVTTPNNQFAFRINGTNSPTLVLQRGRTYTFDVNTTASFHPFRINSPGVVNNIITSGTITYTVPTNEVNYTYNCGVHNNTMVGNILTVATPSVDIIGLSVSNNIVIRSTGTANVVAHYKTNVAGENWFSLQVLSNRFVNGTTETFCGKPPNNVVFIRVMAP